MVSATHSLRRAAAGGGGRLLGPEQFGQRIAAVRASFDGQVGQQGNCTCFPSILG
jgi:hypothetical protein